MRLTDHVVERLAGQTPCLCGDIETWHRECYAGKSDEQMRADYRRAFAIARRKIRARFEAAAIAAIASAMKVPK